jgi:hypothetical protein
MLNPLILQEGIPVRIRRLASRHALTCPPQGILQLVFVVLALASNVALPRRADAEISGGTGNDPITISTWPTGAAPVFNAKQRVAYWEGPPFGGGQWHGEYRGDAEAFNRVLQDFARLDANVKRLVVHNGTGHSFWLNPNRSKRKEADAQIDWVFVVWDTNTWQQLQGLPERFRPAGDAKGEVPAPQIDVYTGGNIEWANVVVPEGIEVIDERLEAHGFKPQDGTVLEGTVVDVATQQPLASEVQLQLVEAQPEGGYKYTTVTTTRSDEKGLWVLKNAPAGWHRVVVMAEGYVARIVAYSTFEGQPHWSEHNTGLSRPAALAGRVTDAEGRPLADVDVRVSDIVAVPGGVYNSLADHEVKTGPDGRFVVDNLPIGRASVHVYKEGYCRAGLAPEIDTPAEDVSLSMDRSASIEVTIDFSDTVRPAGYIVEIEDARGAAVGRWGGTANIDAEGKVTFKNVPPGRYVLTGRPNPGRESQTTDPIPIDLAGGEDWAATLKAKAE